MQWVLLGVVGLAVVGCEQTQTTQCGNDETTADARPPFMAADGAAGEGGSGGSGLRVDGQSCDVNAECENAYCVPGKNSFGAGVCFSLGVDGCMVVTEPSPFKALCASLSKRLYTCGSAYDPALLGMCADVGVGDIGEIYHCCAVP